MPPELYPFINKKHKFDPKWHTHLDEIPGSDQYFQKYPDKYIGTYNWKIEQQIKKLQTELNKGKGETRIQRTPYKTRSYTTHTGYNPTRELQDARETIERYSQEKRNKQRRRKQSQRRWQNLMNRWKRHKTFTTKHSITNHLHYQRYQ